MFVNYNRKIVERIVIGRRTSLNGTGINVFAPIDEKLNEMFEEARRQKRIQKIKENTQITEKERRVRLLKEHALKISETVYADDYDTFAMFPVEETNLITISKIANIDCKDIRFYIHAINVDDNIDRLNSALKTVLEKHPDRYDILDALLSAGATIDGNLAFTNILKQNVALYFENKDTTPDDIEIENNISKELLLERLDEGKLEYVIVNLTMVLEKKLRSVASIQKADLVEMIDEAHRLNLINDFDQKMLHNLRKARNGIMHQSRKFYYTKPIVKMWIETVYSL